MRPSKIDLVAVFLLVFFGCSNKPSDRSIAIDAKTGDSPYHKNQVKNTIVKHQPELVRCYGIYTATEEGKKNKDGQLKIDWQIDTTGHVENSELVQMTFMENVDTKNLVNCTLEKIRSWRFPEPDTKVYVVHIFNFGKPPQREAPQIIPANR